MKSGLDEGAGGGPLGRAAADPPALDPAWYDAIAVRRSRRRYSDRKVAEATLAELHEFCGRFQFAPGVRVALAEGSGEVFTAVVSTLAGAYGRVEGAPYTAAFIGRHDNELEAGYVGEAFILEATRLGLDTCWVAGSFDRELAAQAFELGQGEEVYAVSPVGHALDRKQFAEKLMSAAVRSAARRQVEDIAPGLVRGVGPVHVAWPTWAITAVEAARLAPSGANGQPWRFRLEGGALLMGHADKTYWTAPIDYGIAMLHVELGAAHEGVTGAWERLPEPDVTRFVPDGR